MSSKYYTSDSPQLSRPDSYGNIVLHYTEGDEMTADHDFLSSSSSGALSDLEVEIDVESFDFADSEGSESYEGREEIPENIRKEFHEKIITFRESCSFMWRTYQQGLFYQGLPAHYRIYHSYIKEVVEDTREGVEDILDKECEREARYYVGCQRKLPHYFQRFVELQYRFNYAVAMLGYCSCIRCFHITVIIPTDNYSIDVHGVCYRCASIFKVEKAPRKVKQSSI